MKYSEVPDFGKLSPLIDTLKNVWLPLLRCVLIVPILAVIVILAFLMFILVIPVDGLFGCLSLLADWLKNKASKDIEKIKYHAILEDDDA